MTTEQQPLSRVGSIGYWKTRASLAEDRVDDLTKAIQEAATLLDFEANLGPTAHQVVLRDVVRQLTAALESGAMSQDGACL